MGEGVISLMEDRSIDTIFYFASFRWEIPLMQRRRNLFDKHDGSVAAVVSIRVPPLTRSLQSRILGLANSLASALQKKRLCIDSDLLPLWAGLHLSGLDGQSSVLWTLWPALWSCNLHGRPFVLAATLTSSSNAPMASARRRTPLFTGYRLRGQPSLVGFSVDSPRD
jgi:hypothetical protein